MASTLASKPAGYGGIVASTLASKPDVHGSILVGIRSVSIHGVDSAGPH